LTAAAPLSDDLRAAEPVLLAFARRALGRCEAVRDLVQETLLAAVANRAPFEGRSQVRTWLIGILSRKIVDHFRAQARDAARGAELAEIDLLAETPTRRPDQQLERRQAIAAVEAALPSLPESERLAVLLVDVEGLDHPEACNALGVKPTHLRVLLHRGRHRLRKAVEHAGM
jgi:RNA polymerase sigma-70 factor (ECF subfamily)